MAKASESSHEQGNSGAGARLRSDAADIRDDVREMGGHIRDAAAEKLHDLRDRASDYFEQGRGKARKWEQGIEGYIQEKPIRALLIAAGVGLLVGVFWRRR
jgi:ElaB/YqjD/DUF883 family membrane-anchored ribosome-binding protein